MRLESINLGISSSQEKASEQAQKKLLSQTQKQLLQAMKKAKEEKIQSLIHTTIFKESLYQDKSIFDCAYKYNHFSVIKKMLSCGLEFSQQRWERIAKRVSTDPCKFPRLAQKLLKSKETPELTCLKIKRAVEKEQTFLKKYNLLKNFFAVELSLPPRFITENTVNESVVAEKMSEEESDEERELTELGIIYLQQTRLNIQPIEVYAPAIDVNFDDSEPARDKEMAQDVFIECEITDIEPSVKLETAYQNLSENRHETAAVYSINDLINDNAFMAELCQRKEKAIEILEIACKCGHSEFIQGILTTRLDDRSFTIDIDKQAAYTIAGALRHHKSDKAKEIIQIIKDHSHMQIESSILDEFYEKFLLKKHPAKMFSNVLNEIRTAMN